MTKKTNKIEARIANRIVRHCYQQIAYHLNHIDHNRPDTMAAIANQ